MPDLSQTWSSAEPEPEGSKSASTPHAKRPPEAQEKGTLLEICNTHFVKQKSKFMKNLYFRIKCSFLTCKLVSNNNT
jgi:hypothetical protein